MTTWRNNQKTRKLFGGGETRKSVSLNMKSVCKLHLPPLFQPYAGKPEAELPHFQKTVSSLAPSIGKTEEIELNEDYHLCSLSAQSSQFPHFSTVAVLPHTPTPGADVATSAAYCWAMSHSGQGELSSAHFLFPVAVPWLLSVKKSKPSGAHRLRALNKASTATDSTTLNLRSWMQYSALIEPY